VVWGGAVVVASAGRWAALRTANRPAGVTTAMLSPVNRPAGRKASVAPDTGTDK